MQQIEAYFAAQGCDTVKVEVFAPNLPARRLYEKFGYEWRDIDTIKRL
jgi:ribosomal protein S18 acetylase RimI-like enzyme